VHAGCRQALDRRSPEVVGADPADERRAIAKPRQVVGDVGRPAAEPGPIGKQIPEQLTPADQERGIRRSQGRGHALLHGGFGVILPPFGDEQPWLTEPFISLQRFWPFSTRSASWTCSGACRSSSPTSTGARS